MTPVLLALVLSAPPTAAKATELARARHWEELYLGFAALGPAGYPPADQQRIAGALAQGCAALLAEDAVMAYSLGERSVAFATNADGLLCLALGAVKTDQRSAAEEALRKGVTRYPKDGRFPLELGRLLLAEEDGPGAAAALRAVPRKSPQAAEAQTLLGKATQLTDEGAGAKAELRRVEREASAHEARAGATSFTTYESSTDDEGRRVRANASFRFRYFSGKRDFGERADYEGRVQGALEVARQAARRALGEDRGTPLDVILYSREEFTLHHGPQAAQAIAGFYSGNAIRMNDSAEITPKVQGTLVHEYTHAVIDELTTFSPRGLPVWVNEGLAEYAEWQHQGFDHAPAAQQTALRGLAQSGRLPALAQMSEGPLVGMRDAGLAYALAGTAVAELVKRRGMPELIGLIRDAGAGRFAEGFERRYGREVARFDEELKAELKAR